MLKPTTHIRSYKLINTMFFCFLILFEETVREATICGNYTFINLSVFLRELSLHLSLSLRFWFLPSIDPNLKPLLIKLLLSIVYKNIFYRNKIYSTAFFILTVGYIILNRVILVVLIAYFYNYSFLRLNW